MQKLSSLLGEKFNKNRPKNLSQEFQVFAVYLCESLGDSNYPMYMRLAKNTDRGILNEALTFTKGYSAAKSKPKVFLWKVKQLKIEQKEREKAKEI
jgi:hypothetical protein